MDAQAIMTVSASVVALTQLFKWSGVDDKHGPFAVMALSFLGVAFWGFDQGDVVRGHLFAYFAGWVVVATSAAGVFGFTRAAREAVTKTTSPPSGAGNSATT